MRNVKIPGAQDDVGASQGFAGVSVLYTTELVRVGDREGEVPVAKLAYQLDPDEVRALVEGGRLVLTLLVRQIPPHRLEVQPV